MDWRHMQSAATESRTEEVTAESTGKPTKEKRVYIIHCPKMGLCKIGHTHELNERFRTICVTSPVDVYLFHSVRASAKVERAMHVFFWDARSHGEWFRCDPYDASSTLELLANNPSMVEATLSNAVNKSSSGRKPLSDKSETVRLELRIPAALKAAVEAKLKPGQTLSGLIREHLEKVANKPCPRTK